jgi:hypothetical protein
LASSPAAIHCSVERRRKRLEERLREEKLMRQGGSAPLTRAPALPSYDPDDIDEVPGAEAEQAEDEIVDQATAAATLAELEAEIVILRTWKSGRSASSCPARARFPFASQPRFLGSSNSQDQLQPLEFVGERAGTRTQDLLIKSQMLYRLSYALGGGGEIGGRQRGVNRAACVRASRSEIAEASAVA